MEDLNDLILVNGAHTQIRIVVFNNTVEVEGGQMSNIGFELKGCPDCLMNAIAAAICNEEKLLQLFAAALSKGVRMKAQGATSNHLSLFRHDKNGINPNLN